MLGLHLQEGRLGVHRPHHVDGCLVLLLGQDDQDSLAAAGQHQLRVEDLRDDALDAQVLRDRGGQHQGVHLAAPQQHLQRGVGATGKRLDVEAGEEGLHLGLGAQVQHSDPGAVGQLVRDQSLAVQERIVGRVALGDGGIGQSLVQRQDQVGCALNHEAEFAGQ